MEGFITPRIDTGRVPTLNSNANQSFANLSETPSHRAFMALAESFESDAGGNLKITSGEDLATIMSTPHLWARYKKGLTEGVQSAYERNNLNVLMDNSATALLSEAVTANLTQVSALSMPLIRRAYPRLGMKNALPTQAVTMPRFQIQTMQPILRKQNGEVLELPQALRDPVNKSKVLAAKPVVATTLTANVENDLVALTSGAVAGRDAINPNLRITEIVVKVDHDNNGGTAEQDITKVVSIPFNNDGFATYTVALVDANGNGAPGAKDVILGFMDFKTGKLNVGSQKGKLVSFKVTGTISDESNAHGDTLEFRSFKKEVNIGTQPHLNAAIPVEVVQDTMANFGLDYASEMVNNMATVEATRLDQELFDFIAAAHADNVAAGAEYERTFNVFPSQQYTGSPQEWRNEIRSQFSYLANLMKKQTGMPLTFMLVGSPVDMEIIPNVDWTFTAGTDTRAGEEQSYSVGAFAGSNRFRLVQSDSIPDGAIWMIAIPTEAQYMTFMYYPYSTILSSNYRNPQNPLVPNVMVARRDEKAYHTPLVAKINIQNNTGDIARNFTA